MDRTVTDSVSSDNRKSKIQNLKWVTFLAIFILLVGCGRIVEAQQVGKIPRIGLLFTATRTGTARLTDAFREGLRELGYVEAKTIALEIRWGEGRIKRLPALASELLQLNVEVIIAGGGPAVRAAKKATSLVPIVMVAGGDPVRARFVASLSRPGGNITGLTTIASDLTTRRLELLKEVVPGLSRVAILWDPESRSGPSRFKEANLAARSLGLELQSLEVRSRDDIESAFRVATRVGAQALIPLRSPLTLNGRKFISTLAIENRLPVIYDDREFMKSDGFMSYGTNLSNVFRRAATYVDKILKGAKPADLPVEQPTKFDLVINLKRARQLGITIPPSILYRADKVIK